MLKTLKILKKFRKTRKKTNVIEVKNKSLGKDFLQLLELI